MTLKCIYWWGYSSGDLGSVPLHCHDETLTVPVRVPFMCQTDLFKNYFCVEPSAKKTLEKKM